MPNESATTTLPGKDEIQRRLLGISDDPRLVKHLYPYIVTYSDVRMEAVVVVFMVQLEAYLYLKVTPEMRPDIQDLVDNIIAVLIDDDAVREEALLILRKVRADLQQH